MIRSRASRCASAIGPGWRSRRDRGSGQAPAAPGLSRVSAERAARRAAGIFGEPAPPRGSAARWLGRLGHHAARAESDEGNGQSDPHRFDVWSTACRAVEGAGFPLPPCSRARAMGDAFATHLDESLAKASLVGGTLKLAALAPRHRPEPDSLHGGGARSRATMSVAERGQLKGPPTSERLGERTRRGVSRRRAHGSSSRTREAEEIRAFHGAQAVLPDIEAMRVGLGRSLHRFSSGSMMAKAPQPSSRPEPLGGGRLAENAQQLVARALRGDVSRGGRTARWPLPRSRLRAPIPARMARRAARSTRTGHLPAESGAQGA